MFIFPKLKVNWKLIVKVFLTSASMILFMSFTLAIYFFGLVRGINLGQEQAEAYFLSLMNGVNDSTQSLEATPTPTLLPKTDSKPKISWGGPELWEAVNKRRVELGVNSLSTRSELCTIASIRLNELLDLEKLDNHEGFSNMGERRSDLQWIFDKYSVVAEFLAVGGKTPEETVSLWENTLGHRKLLSGGEYVWGCIYAQNTFAVAITAF